MQWIYFSLFLLFVLLSGFVISIFLEPKEKSFGIRFGLAYVLGGLFVTLQLFVGMFLLRLQYGNWLFILTAMELVALVLILKRKKALIFNRLDLEPLKKIGAVEVVFGLLISLQLVFAFSNAVTRPVVAYDSLAVWSMRAKALFYDNAVKFDPSEHFFLGGQWHGNYPWHIPLLEFWEQKISGRYSEILPNLIFVAYYLAIISFLYGALKLKAGRKISLFMCWLYSSMPLVVYHASNPYTDLPLSLVILIAFYYFVEWLQSGEEKSIRLTGLFAGLAFFIKLDALMLIISLIIAVIVRAFFEKPKKSIYSNLANLLIPLLLVSCPFIIFNTYYGLGFSNVSSGFGFHPEALKGVLVSLFVGSSWNIWWFAILATLMISIKKILKDKMLLGSWILFFILLSGFLLLYLFTETYQFALDNTATSRNLLTLLPISVYLAGLTWAKEINA